MAISNVTSPQLPTMEKLSLQHSFQIPPDFDRQWGRSDVIILAKGGTVRQLHVNKNVLATFSPVFNALFFGDFAEKDQDTVTIDLEYDVLKEILRLIHSVNRNYGQTGHTLYSAKMLASLYRAGDLYDIPMIRELCKQQFVQIAPKDAFEVTIELDLHQEKSEILKKMTFQDIEAFLAKKGSSLVLSACDMAEIVKKTQEYENERPRCTSCRLTNVVEVSNRSRDPHAYYGNTSPDQKCYKCQKCNVTFYVQSKK